MLTAGASHASSGAGTLPPPKTGALPKPAAGDGAIAAGLGALGGGGGRAAAGGAGAVVDAFERRIASMSGRPTGT